MNVVFLSPAWPAEMPAYVRGLREVGARVWGVGDGHPGEVGALLDDYLRLPGWDRPHEAILGWLAGRHVDRIETNWEILTVLAAELRQARGLDGMSADTVRGFRDKPLMRQRVQAAGLRVPRSIRAASRGQIHAFVEDCGLPIILKPVAGAGSADTWRVDRPEELDAIIDRVGGHHEVSCEEFVVGDELTYETVCIRGRPVYESVCRYEPNCLVARQNEWISPIIQSLRDLDAPELRAGVELGRKVLGALGMGTGFTHMEWFRKANGAVVFGEIACRPPGANMVDLMNYTGDIDLFREWARVVCWESFEASTARPWSAAIVFKRAEGHGRIRRVTGMDAFRQRFGGFIARDALAPVGTERRDWEQTFLSDGNVVVRHPDEGTCLAMARAFAATVRMYAG